MIRIQRQLVLNQDPSVVRTRLADLPAMAAMIPNVTGWAMPERDRLVVRIRGRLAWVPVEATALLRVTEAVEPGSLRLEGHVVRGDASPVVGSKPGLRSPRLADFTVRWNVSPQCPGARVEYMLELQTETALEGWLRPLVDSRLGRLEAKLERVVGQGHRAGAVAA